MWEVNQGDVIEWANGYKGDPFHALLGDAPYELNFMGKKWDNSGISFRKETWEAYWQILFPGAFGMVFGGSRTAHRMAVAIEDAGFVIHPMIGWVYSSGFPKASRIDTKIDTDLAKAWTGHRYGLQALKPALEPIIVFQKPYEDRPLDSMVKYGAGALNIEDSRIGTEQVISNRWEDDAHPFGGGAGNRYKSVYKSGRWPANLVLSHAPDCTPECCAEGCAVKAMGEKSGYSTSNSGSLRKSSDNVFFGQLKNIIETERIDDSGTGSRFFFNADWTCEKLEEQDGFFYCPKAYREERNAGLDEFEKKKVILGGVDGHTVNPKTGKPPVDIPRANHHVAVKPIALVQHLANLLLPPQMYAPRRIVVPFCGTGSEMIGAMRTGWEVIEGIELEEEYCALARARLSYWQKQPVQRRLL